MKNKIFVIFCLLLAIGMNSCGNKQTTSINSIQYGMKEYKIHFMVLF